MFVIRVLEYCLDTQSLLIFLSVLLVVRVVQVLMHNRSLPPGPWGLPFIGYLPFFKGHAAHLHFSQLARKYGSLFSTRLGNQLIVVISDYKLIRETFKSDEFTGRPETEFSDILGGYGVINSDGHLWKEQRRFLHERLREFGMKMHGSGNGQMEDRIMLEVEMFLRTLKEGADASTDLAPVLSTSISNVICSLMMSVRFEHKDPRFDRFMGLIAEGFRLFGSLTYVNFIPVMKYLPGLQEARRKIGQNRAEMAAFFQETVDSHRSTFDASETPRDLVDHYLLAIEQAKRGGTADRLYEGRDHDRQIQQIMGDLFSAGMETIKTTLLWAVLYMLHHPEVARHVREELDSVVGRTRLPKLEDRAYLPYTEATILEVLRRSSIVPLGTTHATKREVTLGGFRVPKNAQIVPLLQAVHMDPHLWEEPELFKPERFLSHEGKVTRPEFFMPFGVGRRMCLGDVLARMEFFLFFSSLLHCFDLEIPSGSTLPSLRATTGITLTPEDFRICLQHRPLEASSLEFLNSSSQLRIFGAH